MSFSSNLKALKSVARSLDSLSEILVFDDISLEDYVFIADILNRVSALQMKLNQKGVVLEIEEDEEGHPIGHRVYVRKSDGGTIGVTTMWDNPSSVEQAS